MSAAVNVKCPSRLNSCVVVECGFSVHIDIDYQAPILAFRTFFIGFGLLQREARKSYRYILVSSAFGPKATLASSFLVWF
jgi:hypothetical protein